MSIQYTHESYFQLLSIYALVSNGKGRLYSGLQDRNTIIRGNMLGLSKTSIFRRVLQQEVRISQQFNINMNESNNAAEVAAALYNNKL